MRTASEGERERVRLNGAQVYGAIALLLIGPLIPNHRGRAQASQGPLPKMLLLGARDCDLRSPPASAWHSRVRLVQSIAWQSAATQCTQNTIWASHAPKYPIII